MNKTSKIYVAGHKGLAGSAIWRELNQLGFTNLIGFTSKELDLRLQHDVDTFFEKYRPEYVFLAAGHVGGIKANNDNPADFIYNNLAIQNNVISASFNYRVKKLLFLGSSCVYPKHAPQPIREEYLMSGALEPTNEPYAIAKIAGIELCQAFRRQHGCDFVCAMPTNLYGKNDNYDLNGSHVLASMIRRFHEAKTRKSRSVTCWGSGRPLREFLFSDDLAKGLVLLMAQYSETSIINVGSAFEVSIKDLSEMVAKIVGYDGSINWDLTQPDGTPRKILDCTRINALGWRAATQLDVGIRIAYQDFMQRYSK